MLPVQRSTPAEGSAGGIEGASTTTSRRLATATTSKGRCFRPIRATAPAASIRRSSLKAGIVAPSVMLRKLAAYRRRNQLDPALRGGSWYAKRARLSASTRRRFGRGAMIYDPWH